MRNLQLGKGTGRCSFFGGKYFFVREAANASLWLVAFMNIKEDRGGPLGLEHCKGHYTFLNFYSVQSGKMCDRGVV